MLNKRFSKEVFRTRCENVLYKVFFIIFTKKHFLDFWGEFADEVSIAHAIYAECFSRFFLFLIKSILVLDSYVVHNLKYRNIIIELSSQHQEI